MNSEDRDMLPTVLLILVIIIVCGFMLWVGIA